MRKALPIILLLAITPALAGCNVQTLSEALGNAASFMTKVRSTLVEVRAGISRGCSAIGLAEQEAASVGPACVQKVSRLRAGVEAICRNQDKLTDDVVGNYFSTVANAVKQAQASCR